MQRRIVFFALLVPIMENGFENRNLLGDQSHGQETSVSVNFQSDSSPDSETVISETIIQDPLIRRATTSDDPAAHYFRGMISRAQPTNTEKLPIIHRHQRHVTSPTGATSLRELSGEHELALPDAWARQHSLNKNGKFESQEKSFEKIWRRKSIHDTRINIQETSNDAPSDRSVEIDYGTGDWLTFYPVPRSFHWEAPEIRYRPLYFEDVELERYGRSHSHPRQMLRSAFHFAKSTAMLPHKMWHDRPLSCDWPLGFARPGTCTPSIHQRHYYGHRTGNSKSAERTEEIDYRFH